MSVVLAGGGTAGHVQPALAVADALRRADPGMQVICLGTSRGLETRLVPAKGYELALIPPVPLPRSLTPKLLAVPGHMAKAVREAGRVLDRSGAQAVVGFGGYVSTPAYLAAWRRRIPIVVHDANVRAGLANRVGAMLSPYVFTAHPETRLRHAVCVGIPLRSEISQLDRHAESGKARAHFGLRPDLPVLLVTGGSQGAQALNAALAGAATALRSAGIQVLHIAGPANADSATVTSDGPPWVTLPYADRMELAYAAADFALCRSGAMTCAEMTTVGLPAAYVPLPHGNGEQRLNALPIERAGGGLIVANEDLTPEWITRHVIPVLTDPRRLAEMAEAAASLGSRGTDDRLAAAILRLVRAS
jgi:UDP-N-acetylglucosamine--N-acetylmuramyl-(pentapeptide) pyrophosphoryl-undecaprenol N-acetylglucosamine transferase